MRLYFIIMLVYFNLFNVCTAQNIMSEQLSFLNYNLQPVNARIWSNSIKNNGIIVIDVNPSLSFELLTQNYEHEKFDLQLRQKLVEAGVLYFEFGGKKDSIVKFGQKYPAATYHTKAIYIENAISFLLSKKETKNHKIILLGQSEGGISCAKVASINESVKALVLLSTPGLSGYETFKYQASFRDTLLMKTYGTEPEYFKILNEISSLNYFVRDDLVNEIVKWILSINQ